MTNVERPGGGDTAQGLHRVALQTAQRVLLQQRHADEELRQAKQALDVRTDELEASLSLLMATIESTPDGIVVDNLRGKIIVHNSKFAAMWRIPSEMMQRRGVHEVSVHAIAQLKDGAAFQRRIDAMREAPEVDRHDVVELIDGRVFERYASPHRVGGVCVGIVANWRDVTERQRAVHAVHDRDLAERANRAKNDFIGRVSHELRTPLNAVLGFSEVMQLDEREPLSPVQRQRAERIHKAGSHLLLLIDDLLDVSRLEAGSVHLRIEDTDVVEVLQQAINDLQERASGLGVELAALRTSTPAYAPSDRLRLKQVLHNLLSNAVKYNRRGGSVRADIDGRADSLRITITDTGWGMDAGQLQRLFNPFDRLGRETSAVEGTGIGLVIARNLIELMGGSLAVRSQVGIGSEFVLTLPTEAARYEEIRSAAPPHRSAPHTGPLLRGKLLYVEDNAVNRLLMQAYLDMRPGIELVMAVDGRSGIAAAGADDFALIMIDMMLPDMGGGEALTGIRALPSRSNPRCIAVSANAMPADISDAIAVGFDGYLTKPLSAATLMREIDRLASLSPGASAGDSS